MNVDYSSAQLLVVDDLSSDRQLIRYALEEINFKGLLEFERSGQAVLDRYLPDPDPRDLPDLILLDVNLSDINGREVLRKLKQNHMTCAIPVVMFSSSNAPEASEECYSLGAGGYLVKPTDFDEMRKQLASTLAFWMQDAVKRIGKPSNLRLRP